MSDGLNVTNAVPPICNRHGESMVLSFYDSHGYRNGYVCRSCMAERTQQGMNVDHDPAKSLLKPLPLSEKAELQVSLLNEIGLTLTAVAKEQVAQAETLKTYKLSLEGIQGSLVDLDAKVDGSAEAEETIINRMVETMESLATRLAQIEERLETIEHYHGHEQGLLTSVAREVGQRPTLSDIEKANQLLIQQVKRNGRKASKRKGKRPVRKSS